MKKIKFLAVILLPPMGMGCTVTALQCGTDGDSSFINLETSESLIQNARTMAELCNFSQEKN